MNAAADQLRYSLRFLSGKNQGTEYVMDDPMDVVVGRALDADLILVEGMVSRRHARFRLRDRTLTLDDLGSTNGTFVNGEKTRSCVLVEGDRVLIGTSILKVVFTESPLGTRPPPPAATEIDQEQTANRYQVDGELSDFSVPELLEMFSHGDRSAVIEITSSEGDARITVRGGRVKDCRSDSLPDAPANKAMLRVLGMTKGSFAVRRYDEPRECRIDEPIAEVLVDGLFKLDEFEVLMQRLPESHERVIIARPLMGKLSALDEGDLDMLELAHNHGSIGKILDESPETDLEAATRLLALLDGGYLRRA